MCACVRVCVYADMYVCCTCECVRVFVRACVRLCVFMHVCMCIHVVNTVEARVTHHELHHDPEVFLFLGFLFRSLVEAAVVADDVGVLHLAHHLRLALHLFDLHIEMCIYTCMCLYTYGYIYIYMDVYIYMYVYAYIYIYIYICM